MNLIQIETTYKPEVALEHIVANEGSFSDSVTSIANYFPSLKSMFSGSADILSDLSDKASGLVSKLSSFSSSDAHAAEGVKFSEFSKVKLQVPESFSGNLCHYAEFLQRSDVFLNNKAIPMLDEFYVSLAAFASNKDSKITLLDTSNNYKSVEATYQELVKESIIYFGKRRHNSGSATIGDTFMDDAEFTKTMQISKQLVKKLSPGDVKNILGRVNKISSVLNVVIEDAQKREFDKASHAAVKSLANGVFAMAEIVEFYAVTYYRITELATVMGNNAQTMKKLR